MTKTNRTDRDEEREKNALRMVEMNNQERVEESRQVRRMIVFLIGLAIFLGLAICRVIFG